MGQEIVYCFKCQTRIVGADFGKGAAFQVGNNVCCSKCAAELLNTLPPKDRENLLAQMFKATQERRSGSTNAALPALAAPMASSSTRMRSPAPAPGGTQDSKSSNTVVLALVSVVVLAVLGLLLLNSGGKPAATSLPRERPGNNPQTEIPLPAFEHAELRRAREFARTNPKDIEGQIVSWRAALLAVQGTPNADVAQRELERLQILMKDAVQTALQVLEVQTKPYLTSEEFSSATDILRAARGRFGAPEWTLAVDRKIDTARAGAVALLPGLKEKAADARKRGAADEIKTIQARVRKWGLSDLSSDLETVLVDAPPPSKPGPAPTPGPAPAASKELDAYLPRWEAAFGRAAAGDAAGAAQELASVVQALTEAPLKAEGGDDVESLRRAAAAMQEIREAIARTPKGQKVSLERWNEAGIPEKIEGSAAGAEPGRLLLRTEAGLSAVDVGELTLRGIADLFLARAAKKPGDERTAALLAALGGDLERAAKLNVELPERWRNFAPKAQAALTAGREADARRLFAEAEDAAGDPVRVGTAVANYKTLLAEFGATAFVARNRASLTGRPNLGKEYLFHSDSLRAAGTFTLAKAGKMDAAWLSERDSEAAAAGQNYVELSFTALPETDYRLFVYTGGCCLETFSFGVQGTEMVLAGARTAADPGGPAVIPIRPSLSLKKVHAAHTGPKSPARWDWIPIPLPKYATPGVKVVRLQTDQQGFAVAYAFVSALTSTPPRESELKELEKSRPRRRSDVSEKDIPGLVAHWRLDEGSGVSIAEANGKVGPGSIQGAAWTTGRTGSGLRFDGVNSYAELPNPPALDKLTDGSYSIMAWFKPEDQPTGQGEQNNSAYAILMRYGKHMGLDYLPGGSFCLLNWNLSSEDPNKAVMNYACSKAYPVGQFYHVAGVVDRASGKSALYVNGKLEGSDKFDTNSRPVSYGGNPWRLGIGYPNGTSWRWAAKGVIDEVRLYSRALSTSEIETIARLLATPVLKSPADARPWKPIFDGQTARCLTPAVFNAWQVKDGFLTHVSGIDNAAQTNDEFGDGDLRIRFESRNNIALWFHVRQSGAAGARVSSTQLESVMNQGEHELIFSCRGLAVTATLDGKPLTVETVPPVAPKGLLQFNCSTTGSLRIKALDFRDTK